MHPLRRRALAARLGPPVADAALAGLRGGFVTLDGRVSIVLQLRQTVSVDGVQVGATGADARSPAPLLVFQNGAANVATAAAGLPASGTLTGVVLQNTLSGQQLQVQRVIDVSVDSLQRLRGIALQRDVVNGLVGSLRR